MGELVRHRQTKGAGTDRSDLQSPRHTSTLPQPPLPNADTHQKQPTPWVRLL